MENRNGLAVGAALTRATGTAEREAALALLDRRRADRHITLGADKAYDVTAFVEDLRTRQVRPHIAVDGRVSKLGVVRKTAIDGRTTRHPGYRASQICRKRIEEVFLPGASAPLVLDHETPELQLLQRIRDEAHRFAIEHHRTRRDRAMTGSIFDDLPGIGPARKRALLAHFGSPEAVLAASREELEAVPGLPGKVGRELYAMLNRTAR